LINEMISLWICRLLSASSHL